MLTWYAMSVTLAVTTSTMTSTATVATEVAAAVTATTTAAVVVEVAPAVPAPTADASPPGSAPIVSPPEASAKAEAPQTPAFAKRFAGSQMWMDTSITVGTFDQDLTLDYNPTVVSSLSFSPRFSVTKDWQLRGRIGVSGEWTDSDYTGSRVRPELTDTTLQLFYRSIPRFFGVKAQVAANLILPTSDISNARTLRAGTGLTGQVFRGWGVAGGSVMAMGIMSYQHRFFGAATPGVDTPLPYARQCGLRVGQESSTSCVEQGSGIYNVRDVLSWSAVLLGSWGDWSPGMVFTMIHNFPFKPEGGFEVSDAVQDPNGVRVSTSFAAWMDYLVQPWLTAELGYSFSQIALNGQSNYGNPLYNRYGDSRLYLGANIGLEQLYGVIIGAEAGAGGVVRN